MNEAKAQQFASFTRVRAHRELGPLAQVCAGSMVLICALRPQVSPAQEALEEIVVTAQKREQSVEKVPISMTVLGGQQLDQSTAQGVADILDTVPAVSTLSSYQGGGTLVTIRGVSAGEALLNGSGTVGYYLDSVPFGLIREAIGPDESAYDMQRIEVLRGPQGTLYGANALNGVVRVLTNDANLSNYELKMRASGSDTNGAGGGIRGDLALNAPIVPDVLGARAVIGYEDAPGWISSPVQKDFNDAHLLNMRLKLNAQPTDGLTVALSGWSSRNTYGGPSVGNTPTFNDSAFAQPIHNNYDTGGLKVAYDANAFSVSSATSYLDYSSNSNMDFTPFVGVASDLQTVLSSHVWSEEVLVTSRNETDWRWSIGDMYRRATEDLHETVPAFGIDVHVIDISRSNAVYGEVTRLLFDQQLELTAGVRYFHDNVSQPVNETFPPTHTTAAATTPRAVITWHPAINWTLYGSYSQGFRSGFPQAGPNTALPAAQPDRLDNYELGSKGALFDGRLKLDMAVYYINWQHVQESITVEVAGVPYSATVNGRSASGPGVDLALTSEVIDQLTVAGSFGWNNLKMDSDVYSGGALLFPEGSRLNLSPEYTASLSADYGFPLFTTGLDGKISVSGNYVSNMVNRVLLGPAANVGRGDPEFIPKASFSLISKSGWTGTLYADNLSNYQKSPTPGYGGLAEYYGRVRPRTVGLQLEYKY
jgi:iron complex outermembrane recepter protein